MFFSVELMNLVLYCVQQLGIALGLGAQTVMLVAYVIAHKDGVIDDEEAQFLRATRSTLWVALVFIVLSGILITVLHTMTGTSGVVMSPAYLFKLALIAAVIVLTALLHVIPETFAEGLLGGTWYALFLVHILAPVTSWSNLLTLYAVWLVGFNIVWYVIVLAKKERIDKPVVKSSEAMILQKSAPVKKEVPMTQKPIRKPFFSFSFFTKKPVQNAAPEEEPVITPTVPPAPPTPVPAAVLPQIKLDPVPKTPPVVAPLTLRMEEMHVPSAAQAMPVPLPEVKINPPVAAASVPAPQPKYVEKLPGSIATDTPFLPQVPPLQPIPVIMPNTQTPPAAGIPKAAGAPPALQKPEELTPAAPTVPPEIKLGLNVMPKSPDQLK